MIKLKTQLTATVSQKELEIMITDMINTQLGKDTHIADVNFTWSDTSVTVTGTQQNNNGVTSEAPKLTPVTEATVDVMKQPTTILKAEQHKLPFEPIAKEDIFKQVDATKSELGISSTPSFPSVTSKFQVQ